MPHAVAIAFSACPVSDLARARAFYEGLLGLFPAAVRDLPDGHTFCLHQRHASA
jgi:catechol 2,3-dioxygenase-like lactoylglutathione lyase family enzyme